MKLISSTQDIDEPATRLDVAHAGEAILAASGISEPSEEQLAAAYRIAGSQAQRTAETGVPRRVQASTIIAERAQALLATRRNFDPSEQEYLAAVHEVAAELDVPREGIR